MTGTLAVVGLGPGAPGLLAPDAAAALDAADTLFGYATYLDRVTLRPGQRRHASDNREELDRARQALALAEGGARVAVVSAGDAGVFGMASAVFEAIEAGPPSWRALDVTVLPGISAMFAAAAVLGAPLGHDFCAISLSDNLKPWALVRARLLAAAQAGFVMALYNPRSRARPDQLGLAFDALREVLPAATVVAFARAVSRPDQRIRLADLGDADAAMADMATLVLVGSAATRRLARPGGADWVYTPRSAA